MYLTFFQMIVVSGYVEIGPSHRYDAVCIVIRAIPIARQSHALLQVQESQVKFIQFVLTKIRREITFLADAMLAKYQVYSQKPEISNVQSYLSQFMEQLFMTEIF